MQVTIGQIAPERMGVSQSKWLFRANADRVEVLEGFIAVDKRLKEIKAGLGHAGKLEVVHLPRSLARIYLKQYAEL